MDFLISTWEKGGHLIIRILHLGNNSTIFTGFSIKMAWASLYQKLGLGPLQCLQLQKEARLKKAQ